MAFLEYTVLGKFDLSVYTTINNNNKNASKSE